MAVTARPGAGVSWAAWRGPPRGGPPPGRGGFPLVCGNDCIARSPPSRRASRVTRSSPDLVLSPVTADAVLFQNASDLAGEELLAGGHFFRMTGIHRQSGWLRAPRRRTAEILRMANGRPRALRWQVPKRSDPRVAGWERWAFRPDLPPESGFFTRTGLERGQPGPSGGVAG